MIEFSNNNKEIEAYFTVDAFTGFLNNVLLQYGFDNYLKGSIGNVDIYNIQPLPKILEDIPHQIADNNWLNSVQ